MSAPDGGPRALAGALGLRDNQVRRAVRALEARELGHGHQVGRQLERHRRVRSAGPALEHLLGRQARQYVEYGPEIPTAEVRTHWIQEPDPTESFLIRVPVDVEYVHMGMPTGASLWVKLEGEKPEYSRRTAHSAAETGSRALSPIQTALPRRSARAGDPGDGLSSEPGRRRCDCRRSTVRAILRRGAPSGSAVASAAAPAPRGYTVVHGEREIVGWAPAVPRAFGVPVRKVPAVDVLDLSAFQ